MNKNCSLSPNIILYYHITHLSVRSLLGFGTVTGRFGGLGSPPTAPSSTLCGVSLPDMLGDPEQNKHKVHSVNM